MKVTAAAPWSGERPSSRRLTCANAGRPSGPKMDQLAVEHDAVTAQLVRELLKLGKVAGAVASRAGAQRATGSSVDAELGAQAVPFELDRPRVAVVLAWESGAQQHGLDEARELLS